MSDVGHTDGPGHTVTASAGPSSYPDTPWRAGLVTGIGSMPGEDPREAATQIAGELPDLPHLVELPARGLGADMVGRTMAICVDMPAEHTPFGWRLTGRPGRDWRRAADFLAWDCDAAGQAYAAAPWLKIQATGPWTLAAHVETPRGHRAITDAGAAADLAASLAEGIRGQLDSLAARLPGTRFVVQLDEPSLPEVLAGSLSTASGFGTIPAVPPARITDVLREVLAGVGEHPSIVHCCHDQAPIATLATCGADALSIDLARMPCDAAHLDALGEALESGVALLAGLIPTTAEERDYSTAAQPLLETFRRLEMPAARWEQVTVTPSCGLAALPATRARKILDTARDVARLVRDVAADS